MKLKPRLILILAVNVALTLLLTLSITSPAMAAGNQPPVATNDSYSMDENGTLNVPSPGVLGNDNDDDGDSLIAVLKHDVSYGNLTLNSNDSFYYMPNTGYTGTYTFTYQASDGQASSNTATVTITINSNNQAPLLDPIGNKSVKEGQTLEFTVSATDPNEDSLVYSANNLPSGANFNQSTHVFSWTLGSGQAGTYNDVYFEVSDGSLFDFEYITISVSSGGGGGGSVAGFTNVSYSVTSTGEFVEDVTARSIDNRVKLNIAKGTVSTNQMGQSPRYIKIEEKTLPPPPPENAEIVGVPYDITSIPAGVSFNPPIDITFKYKDDEVPQGVAPKNLLIAMYDWDSNQWYNLDCTVNPDKHIVISELSHFSTYAILAYINPASFEASTISVNPEEVELGESVDISVIITNTGDLTDSYQVNLKLDDVVVQTKEVRLEGHDSERVTFSVNVDTTGVHKASVGDTLVLFTVSEPAVPSAFDISNIVITPTVINLGESAEVSVLVSNTSESTESYEVVLRMDDVIIQRKEVTFAGGDSDMVSFSVTPDTVGEHTISIGDKVAVLHTKAASPSIVKVKPDTGPDISRFDVTPIYESKTGELISTRIDYQIDNAEELEPGDELILRVYFDGQLWDEVQVLTLSQLQANGDTGNLSYIPSKGWTNGTYIFQAELRKNDGLVQSSHLEKFTLIPESVTAAVSWGSLGVIIGITLLVVTTVVIIVLYHRRETLRGYIE